MQIQQVNLPFRLLQDIDLSRLQVGQRLQVEVVSSKGNQEGFISLNGKMVKAKLEVPVEEGDRFWTTVKETGENGVTLIRDPLQALKMQNLSPEQILTLLNRGFPLDPEISKQLQKFINSTPTSWLALLKAKNPLFGELIARLWAMIPRLAGLAESAGYGEGFDLESYYHFLGLGYERLLREKYQSKQREMDQSSLKALLLQILSGKGEVSLSPDEREAVKNMLDDLTGQQLWIQTGSKENAYCLLHFPFQDNGIIYYCKVAAESSRKGRKLDLDHCHLALQAETPNLGLIGADLIIHEQDIRLTILHDEIEELSPLIQELSKSAEEGLAQLGYHLLAVAERKFEDLPQFTAFLAGQQFSGVDVKR